MVTYFYYHC